MAQNGCMEGLAALSDGLAALFDGLAALSDGLTAFKGTLQILVTLHCQSDTLQILALPVPLPVCHRILLHYF